MLPNLYRTLLFNIKAFGLLKGLKLPVYVYGKVKVYSMGKIDVKCPLRRGLITLGMNEQDVALRYSIWNNQGVIEVHGPVYINFGTKITNQGTIVFSGGNAFGYACSLIVKERLEFGHDTSMGYYSEISDTDAHYTIDVNTRKVGALTKPVYIGNFNWMGSHSYIKKGTRTPDYTIVASPNAMLCKDYCRDVEPYSILGGSPAKVIAKGKRRIYNFKNEQMVREAMRQKGEYSVSEQVNLDEFCRF